MSLRFSVCSTTSCQVFSREAWGGGCPSAAAIEFSLKLLLDFCSQPDCRRPASAPQLDAIFGIVNMRGQLSCSASHGDAIGILACDKGSNNNNLGEMPWAVGFGWLSRQWRCLSWAMLPPP